MPKIKTSRTKPPPEGFDEIEDVLENFARKMRDVESSDHEGKRKNEAVWAIFKVDHSRSRYIYDLYYTREAISKPLYDWLLKQGYANAGLIAKWKKSGYEKLCCLTCIAATDKNYVGSVCLCRVPKAKLKDGLSVQCVACGCRGCASTD